MDTWDKFHAELDTIRRNNILFYCASICSIFIGLTRLTEPMIWHSLQELLCTTRKTSASTKDRRQRWLERMKEDTLCSFLNSSAKTAYVYLILEGVCKVLRKREYEADIMSMTTGTAKSRGQKGKTAA